MWEGLQHAITLTHRLRNRQDGSVAAAIAEPSTVKSSDWSVTLTVPQLLRLRNRLDGSGSAILRTTEPSRRFRSPEKLLHEQLLQQQRC